MRIVSTLALGTGSIYFFALLLHWVFLSVAGFHTGADTGQHVLCGLRKFSIWVKFEILLKGFSGAVGRDHLVALQRSLADQVDALPVVGISFGGIGGNHFVESHNRFVDFACIGEHGSFVEKVGGGVRGIELGCLVVVGDGLVGLLRFSIYLCQVVVIGSHLQVVFRIFLRRLRSTAQLNCLLISGRGHLVALLFFRRIGLLGGGHAIGVAEFEPDEIARCIDLIGFVQGCNCGFVIAGIGRGFGGVEFVVERTDSFVFGRGFSGGLRFRFGLFRCQSLSLSLRRLFFL